MNDKTILAIKEKRREIYQAIDLLHANWETKNLELVKYYGERCLLLNDEIVCAAATQTLTIKGRPPSFRADRPEQNVISFSLFGNQERYLIGAVKNVMAANEYYPGWRCRFYCDDTVPKKILADIAKAGGDIRMMPRPQHFADGLFWRFLVWEDPSVVHFLVRDVDSVVNHREAFAVNEWLVSGKFFHIMRDYYGHVVLMCAGMWGGVAGVLPPLAILLKGFTYDFSAEKLADQQFLADNVWPLIKNNCLIHDRIFRVFNAIDFPPGSELSPGRHVGDNDYMITLEIPATTRISTSDV